MRVVVWGINYAPEQTGIAPFNVGLCDFLQSKGHQVEMVTTFPYYPAWRKLPGDTGTLFRTEDLDGVRVHRCWHYVPRNVTPLRRMIHELTFGLTSFGRVLTLARPDLYVVVSPPLILGPFARIMAACKRRPYVFHVQDLQPDAAVGLGMVRPGIFTRVLYAFEAFAYRGAARVTGISKGMIAAFDRKRVEAEKRALFPNWVRWYGRNEMLVLSERERGERARAFRAEFGIAPAAFLASYSGNLGRKQGLETLVEAARRLEAGEAPPTAREAVSGRSLELLLVGDGAMRATLAAQISAMGLRKVRLLPLLTESNYLGLLCASDVALILQAPGTGKYFFPSKLLSALSAGTPVVCAADADSELAQAVTEGGFGVTVPAASPERLADTLRSLAADGAWLESLRIKTGWVAQFSGARVLSEFEQGLHMLVDRR